MKTANTKISSQQKTVLNEIRSLRKLPKTSENKTLSFASSVFFASFYELLSQKVIN